MPPRIADLLATSALPRLDTQLLLLHALGRGQAERAWLLAHDDAPVDAAQAARFTALCARRAAGEPVAYLVGQKAFAGLLLGVDARVLVPRPETETLVDWALELLAPVAAPRVTDLGTGSGAIALALKQARPDAAVTAIDASEAALAVARANGQRLALAVDWRRGDWLAQAPGGQHLIASNPPYVRAGDPHLAALQHEPAAALVAGADGLADLRRIVAAAAGHLAAGGWLVLEHGFDQGQPVRQLLARAGFTRIETRRDLAGLDRCSGGQRAASTPGDAGG